MKLYIYPHDMASEGSKELSIALSAARIRRERSNFRRSQHKTVINWGNSRIDHPEVLGCKILNRPEVVNTCANKLTFFQAVDGKDVRIPPFTTDTEVVKKWLESGKNVCARTILRGSGADGLIIFDALGSFVKAPMWTQYVPKRDEYRVHVIAGTVVAVQQKRLKTDFPEDNVNWRIRNLENGFIYARENVNAPEDVTRQATKAIEAVGLDFGAVDVIYNQKRDEAYVLEVNTAPGLQGSTVQDYAKAFKEKYT